MGAARRRHRLRSAALRRASSTRRSRRSGRATSATARRTPGRRRRSLDASPSIGHRVIGSVWIDSAIRPISTLLFDPRSEAADDLPGNRADRRGHLAHVDAIAALLADDHDLVARRDVRAGHVRHQHVHAHRTDDRRAAAANQHGAAAGEPQIQAVGVAGRHDRDGGRTLGRESRAVAGDLARPQPLHGDDPAAQRHHRREASVDASGGGTMP